MSIQIPPGKYGFMINSMLGCEAPGHKCIHLIWQGMHISMSDTAAPTHLQPAIGSRSGNRALSVMDQIREAILGGSIGAGERLNEVRLGKTLAGAPPPGRGAPQALAGGEPLGYG